MAVRQPVSGAGLRRAPVLAAAVCFAAVQVAVAGAAVAGAAAGAGAGAGARAGAGAGAGAAAGVGADAQPARRAAATLEFTVPVGDLVWLDARTLVVPDSVLQPPADGSDEGLAEVGLRLYRLGDDGTPTLQARTLVWRDLTPSRPRAEEGGPPLDVRVTVVAGSRFVVARVDGPDAGSAPAVVLDRATLTPLGTEPGLHPALFLPDDRLFGWYERPGADGTPAAGPGPQPPGPASRPGAAGAPAAGEPQNGLFRLEAGADGLVHASLEQLLWSGSPGLEGHAVSGDLRYLLTNTFSGYVLTDLTTAERQPVYRSAFLGPPVRSADGQTVYAMDGRGNLVLFEAASLRESTTVLMWSPGEAGPCRFWFAYGPVAAIGRMVLFLCDPGVEKIMGRATGGVTTGQATLWAFDVGRREKRPLLPVEVADAGQWLLGQRLVAVSPDGRFVAVRENLHRLSIWRLEL